MAQQRKKNGAEGPDDAKEEGRKRKMNISETNHASLFHIHFMSSLAKQRSKQFTKLL